MDRTLGLIISVLALTVAFIGAGIAMFTGAVWAMDIVLMAISWWFGATMVWLAGKLHREFNKK